MKKLTALIVKNPVKVLLFTFAILVVIMVGATQITLKTGNDTLISDQSDIYKDNEDYQTTFGKDPIILIFDEEALFEPSTLKLMHKMQEEVKDLDGIFAINSPVTVMNQISTKMYSETSSGLTMMSNGLQGMSDQLGMLGGQLAANDGSGLPDMDALATNMNNLIDAQNQLDTGLINMFSVLGLMQATMGELGDDLDALKIEIEADPLLVDELQLVNDIKTDTNTLNANLTQLGAQSALKNIPVQTVQALGSIVTSLSSLSTVLNDQLTSLQTLSTALLTMSTNLGGIATNLGQIQQNFNAFAPSFPTSDETIEMMTYDAGVLKSQFNGFIVAENKIRMVIVLNGNVTDEQVDAISETLFSRLTLENMEDEVLISGKPILDRSIKSSMMESMQYMMISAVVIMILILAFIYKVRMRLLPIFMILIAVIVTVGMMGWLSIGLTMVSMAVFPVLIGLGIDYFIQFQTRYEEERGKL